MIFSIHLTEQEEAVAMSYASNKGVSLSDAFKQALFEKIEDDIDSKIAEKSYAEYLKNPISYSLEDMLRDEGL